MLAGAEALRAELRALGERRAAMTTASEELERETAKLVRRAKGKLATTEVARLVGLSRSSLYSTYGA